MSSTYTVQGKEPDYRKVYPIKEQETGVYSFTIKDENGTLIPASQLHEVKLTLYIPSSGAIVNSRNAQDVKNANNVTISEAGAVVWTQQVADVTMVDDTLETEIHRCLFLFTWQTGARSKPYEVDFEIENLGKLT